MRPDAIRDTVILDPQKKFYFFIRIDKIFKKTYLRSIFTYNEREKVMYKIGVDTSTWRDWFDWQCGTLVSKPSKHPEEPTPQENAEAFDRIYRHVMASPSQYLFLYTRTVEMELEGKGYKDRFAVVQSTAGIERIAEGIQRYDGVRYVGDGEPYGYVSFYDKFQTYNDKDSLRVILNLSGRDHEAALQRAQPDYKTPNPLHTEPRRREFDLIILEGCLGIADIFLTNDKQSIRRISQAAQEHPENLAVREAKKISFYPANAVAFIEHRSSQKTI
jgi:hypothetical protein